MRRSQAGRRGFLRLVAAGAAGLVAAPFVAGCGELPELVVVDDLHGFSPAKLTVSKGTLVRWKNLGVDPHSVTADPAKAPSGATVALPSGAAPFDSGPIDAGRTWTHRFDVPGTYEYFSTLDAEMGMTGRIVVSA